jgi:hypothetical protein
VRAPDELRPALLDPLRSAVETLTCVLGDLGFLQSREPVDQFGCPGANGARVTGLACTLEIFRELLVLVEVRTRSERKGVRHTNLLSPHAWSPHSSGRKKVRMEL